MVCFGKMMVFFLFFFGGWVCFFVFSAGGGLSESMAKVSFLEKKWWKDPGQAEGLDGEAAVTLCRVV